MTTATGAARAAAERAGVEVRELDTPASTAAAATLFSTIWRAPVDGVLSGDTMRALAGTGNYVAGAYLGRELVGAAAGFFTGDVPRVLRSHVCGVLASTQGRGVGFALKQHQRAWALDHGIESITWTVDPLARRNMYFNLAKLGATVSTYLPDYYGRMQDGINAGDASDRMLLTWRLPDPAVAAASAGRPIVIEVPPGTPVALAAGDRGDPVAGPAPGGDTVRCLLPGDIVHLRQANRELAAAWRKALRTTITKACDAGYHVAGVDSGGHYVLKRSP